MDSRAICNDFEPFPLNNYDVNRHGITSSKTDVMTEVAKDNICNLEIVEGELQDYSSVLLPEILALIFKLLPAKMNRLDEVCKQWRAASEIIYKAENQRLNYLSFCDKNSLSEKMTLTINNRVKIIASIFRGVSRDTNIEEYAKITILHDRFKFLNNKGFLSEDSYLLKFVDFICLTVKMPYIKEENETLSVNTTCENLRKELNILNSNCQLVLKTADFIDQGNALILNYLSRKYIFKDLTQSDEEEAYKYIKSSLVDIIKSHADLKSLRRISLGLRTEADWEKILELDPGRSVEELRLAAQHFYTAQNYKRAAECRMQVLNEGSADNRLLDLRLASLACSHAGFKIEVLSYNEQILKLAGNKAMVNDLRNSAIGCDNAGLYMEASAYWLRYADKFIFGPKREDVDLIIPVFTKAGFIYMPQNHTGDLNMGCFEGTEQVFRDFAAVCKKFEMKKHLADCWERVLKKACNATLDDIRCTGLAYNDVQNYDKVVKYMDLLIEKSGEGVLESDLRVYAEACSIVNLEKGYKAWEKVLEKVGEAATMSDIRQMATLCTGLCFHSEAVKYCDILLKNAVEEITSTDLVFISKAYENVKMYNRAVECLEKRLLKLENNATDYEFRNIARLYSLAGNDLKAVSYYERVIPSSLADLRVLADLYDKVDEYKKAVDCWKKILDLAGKFATNDDISNYNNAILQYESSLMHDPK